MEDWSGDGNKNKNDLRWFENVADNKKSVIRWSDVAQLTTTIFYLLERC